MAQVFKAGLLRYGKDRILCGKKESGCHGEAIVVEVGDTADPKAFLEKSHKV